MREKKIILLAEDEPMVRKLASLALLKGGFTVLEAHSAPDALKASAGRQVDLLITDVKMDGGASGIELATELEGIRPGLKVILMSGACDESVRRFGWYFLPKPFSPDALLTKVEIALGRPGEVSNP